MGKLATATQGSSLSKGAKTMTAQDLIKANWSKIALVAPKHLNQERLMQLSISMINKNIKLATCTPASLLSALMTCSSLGLEPSDVDGLGRAYILPFKNNGVMEATFILGYKGMIDLVRRSGELKSIVARPVFIGDEFDYSFGTSEHIEHVPTATERTSDKLTHVYLVANFKDGGQQIDVMTKDQVERHRKRSNSPNSPAWVNDYEAMACKTIIRANFKYMPVSTEVQRAANADGTTGDYTLDIDPNYPVMDIEPTAEEQPEEPAPELPTAEEQPDFVTVVCTKCGATRSLTADVTDADLEDIACEACKAEKSLRFAE